MTIYRDMVFVKEKIIFLIDMVFETTYCGGIEIALKADELFECI